MKKNFKSDVLLLTNFVNKKLFNNKLDIAYLGFLLKSKKNSYIYIF